MKKRDFRKDKETCEFISVIFAESYLTKVQLFGANILMTNKPSFYCVVMKEFLMFEFDTKRSGI